MRRAGNASRERALGPRPPPLRRLVNNLCGASTGAWASASHQTSRGWLLHPPTPAIAAWGFLPAWGLLPAVGFWDGVYIAKLPLLPACLQGGLGLASPEACTAPPARGLPLVNIWVCLQPKVDKVTGELAGSRRNSKNLELSELSASRLKKHSTNVGRRGGLDTALRCLCFDSSPLWELFWAPAPALLPFTPAELLDLGDHS